MQNIPIKIFSNSISNSLIFKLWHLNLPSILWNPTIKNLQNMGRYTILMLLGPQRIHRGTKQLFLVYLARIGFKISLTLSCWLWDKFRLRRKFQRIIKLHHLFLLFDLWWEIMILIRIVYHPPKWFILKRWWKEFLLLMKSQKLLLLLIKFAIYQFLDVFNDLRVLVC